MPVEDKRLCGFREVEKLYIVGDVPASPCDRLPIEIRPCPTCGYTIKFYRGFRWIPKKYLGGAHGPDCTCKPSCPVCWPDIAIQGEEVGLMWVGKRHYKTPEKFVKEARSMGICKAIQTMPPGLEVGKSWILLAHPEVPIYKKEPWGLNALVKKAPGIFYAFYPTRYEMLLYESQATEERVKELREKGIRVVVVPDGDKAHRRRRVKK